MMSSIIFASPSSGHAVTEQRRFRVVIDPGHGGIDGGAFNGRQKESDLVLEIAQLIERKIQMDSSLASQVEVRLTRSDDSFLDLGARLVPPLQEDVDLFVSVHLNSSPSPRAQGMEVYFDTGGALKNSRIQNLTTNSTLNYIISDLQETGRDKLSRIYAEVLREQWTISPARARRNSFFVLNNNKAPAVLIEAAFLSNKNESERLEDRAHIESIADKIIKSLLTYRDIAYN